MCKIGFCKWGSMLAPRLSTKLFFFISYLFRWLASAALSGCVWSPLPAVPASCPHLFPRSCCRWLALRTATHRPRDPLAPLETLVSQVFFYDVLKLAGDGMRTFYCLYLLHLKIGCEYRKERGKVWFCSWRTTRVLGWDFLIRPKTQEFMLRMERLLRCLNGLVVVLQFFFYLAFLISLDLFHSLCAGKTYEIGIVKYRGADSRLMRTQHFQWVPSCSGFRAITNFCQKTFSVVL